MFIIFVFWLSSDRPSGILFFFVPSLLLSIPTPLFLPSSVFLFYFILALLMRECLGKHSCMSSKFPVAILNGTSFFRQCNYKCTFFIRSKKLKYLSISKPVSPNYSGWCCAGTLAAALRCRTPSRISSLVSCWATPWSRSYLSHSKATGPHYSPLSQGGRRPRHSQECLALVPTALGICLLCPWVREMVP